MVHNVCSYSSTHRFSLLICQCLMLENTAEELLVLINCTTSSEWTILKPIKFESLLFKFVNNRLKFLYCLFFGVILLAIIFMMIFITTSCIQKPRKVLSNLSFPWKTQFHTNCIILQQLTMVRKRANVVITFPFHGCIFRGLIYFFANFLGNEETRKCTIGL